MNRGVPWERHGCLTLVSSEAERTADKRVTAKWRCDCGKEKVAAIGRVRGGYVRSCGHLVREAKHGLKHGMRGTKEYRAWAGAKARCTNPKAKDFMRYGGAGVTFYSGWLNNFEAFLDHIGRCPSSDHSIDRIDCRRGYEPGNVRWATRKIQARNRRSACVWEIKGEVFSTAKEAAARFGVSVHTVWRWTRGQHDKRRGTTTPKRGDCHATPRY